MAENLEIKIIQDAPPATTFTVAFVMLHNTVSVSGFPSFGAASVWVLEWLGRTQRLAAANETHRQMIGAALLTVPDSTEKKKEKM